MDVVSEEVTFHGGTGMFRGYLARPAPDVDRGVLVFHEWWGLDDATRSVCDRLAEDGFAALAPDFFGGRVTADPAEAVMLLLGLNIRQAIAESLAAAECMRSRTGRPVGTVGYCMGGALSVATGCEAADGVAACVSFYGGHPGVSYAWEKLKAPVLAFWAGNDHYANPNIPVFELAARSRRIRYTGVHYPGTEHAFFNDANPATYDRGASTDSWARTLAFLRRHL